MLFFYDLLYTTISSLVYLHVYYCLFGCCTSQRSPSPENPAKRSRKSRRHPSSSDSGSDSEEAAAALAGAQIGHGADELGAGQTVVLTLADEAILDEKGRMRDGDGLKLENVEMVGCRIGK